VDAAEVWIAADDRIADADDRIGEVSSVHGNANAFATVNFPSAMFDEIADTDAASNGTASDDTAPDATAGSHAARVASTIGPAFVTQVTRILGRDRNNFRAAFRGHHRRTSGNDEDSVQRATQKSWAFFAPGCSLIQSRHRFS
jgi:hypothetical protein